LPRREPGAQRRDQWWRLNSAARAPLTREEYPGWEIFRGLHYFWHARLLNASPPLTIRAEELHILRHRITLATRHRQRLAARP
jgi:hypothetical protein